MGLYRTLHLIAQTESELGEVESARHNYQRGFGVLEKIVQSEPKNFKLKRELAAVLGNSANLSFNAKDRAEARRAYLQALEIQKDLARQDPADVDFKNDLALTYHNLSFLANNSQENEDSWSRRLHSVNSLLRRCREISSSGAASRRLSSAWGSTARTQTDPGSPLLAA